MAKSHNSRQRLFVLTAAEVSETTATFCEVLANFVQLLWVLLDSLRLVLTTALSSVAASSLKVVIANLIQFWLRTRLTLALLARSTILLLWSFP